MKINVPRRIDQVEHILGPLVLIHHRHRRRLDRNPALALDIHVVQHLGLGLTRRNRAGKLQHTIRKRALAVIDMSDDRKISYILNIHIFQ